MPFVVLALMTPVLRKGLVPPHCEAQSGMSKLSFLRDNIASVPMARDLKSA